MDVKSYQELEEEALKNYYTRLNSYCLPRHGSYFDYQQWCLAQYQLECIPLSCRQGPNYNPDFDHSSYQIIQNY